jgi:hypothetical protein
MKVFVALFFAALLASCMDTDPTPLKQTRDVDFFTTKIVNVEAHRIVDVCNKLGVPYEANGCAAYYPDKNHCVIYIMPQRFMHDSERLALIGHELWHCRYGQWHD